MPRRSFTGSIFEMSCPSISTVPEVGSTIRLIMRIRVVLPEPDDPTSTVICRAGMTRLKSADRVRAIRVGLGDIAELDHRRVPLGERTPVAARGYFSTLFGATVMAGVSYERCQASLRCEAASRKSARGGREVFRQKGIRRRHGVMQDDRVAVRVALERVGGDRIGECEDRLQGEPGLGAVDHAEARDHGRGGAVGEGAQRGHSGKGPQVEHIAETKSRESGLAAERRA